MSYSFEIIIFLLLLANISLNLYVYKEIILKISKSEPQTYIQPAPEKIFSKTSEKPKTESDEDRIVQGLNNLLVYDGNPSLKKE